MPDTRAARLAEAMNPFVIKPGHPVDLEKDFDPGDTADFVEADAERLLQEGVGLLCGYQARLAAQNTYGLLVIIQALDAAGKDGTISHVMSGVNPQGVSVVNFKTPSAEELDHDYLWRCAKCLPARGDITIFNRSYYEEVIVVRVHPEFLAAQRLPAAAMRGDLWKRRYRDINNWERYLVDNGFHIVKLFLHVSKEEQRQRILARLDEPGKNWKYSPADIAERKYWGEYQQAFSEMLTHTSTSWAPWHVIPADHKWFARVAAAAAIVDALAKIDPHFPTVTGEAKKGLDAARAALEAEGPKPSRARSRPAGTPPAQGVTQDTALSATPGASSDDPAPAASDPFEPTRGDGGKPSAPADALTGRVVRFGEIELAGKRYRNDLVIEAGKIRKRKKKPSKAFKSEGGHTPLSTAEQIPWGGDRLIIGTGVNGALPVMTEVFEEADQRGVEVAAVPLEQALRLLGGMARKEVFAVLHVTC